MGDAKFTSKGSANLQVGSVSTGTRVAPSTGASMLVVGGSLAVARPASMDVGLGLPAGGDVVVGGSVASRSVIHTHGGGVKQGLGSSATTTYSGFAADFKEQSATLYAKPATGSALVSGGELFITGDGSSAQQVFAVDATTLSSVHNVDFKDVPDDASVVVNVAGSSVDFRPAAFSADGVRVDDPFSSGTAKLAAETLWNFVNAGTVQLGGPSPMLGSILVPGGSVSLTTDVNGRLYAGHDLTASGRAMAHNNFPWLGGAAFRCTAERTVSGSPSPVSASAIWLTALPRAIASLLILLIGAGVVAWVIRLRRKFPPAQKEVRDVDTG
jgi:choice-of-anchor A domain-containing protein